MLNSLRAFLVGGSGPRVRWYVARIALARARGSRLSIRILTARLQRKYGVHISRRAVFPPSLTLKHPVGIVIGEGVIIGENVTIYQHVTLGGARVGDWQAGNYPEIGEGTTIFAGAVIVGKVRVGRGCIIGANAVVTTDIPDFSTAVGVPARVVG